MFAGTGPYRNGPHLPAPPHSSAQLPPRDRGAGRVPALAPRPWRRTQVLRPHQPPPAIPTLRPRGGSSPRAPPPARCRTRGGSGVHCVTSGTSGLRQRVTGAGSPFLAVPAAVPPTHVPSASTLEIGPCSPIAQDQRAARPRGDSGDGWVFFGKRRWSPEASEPASSEARRAARGLGCHVVIILIPRPKVGPEAPKTKSLLVICVEELVPQALSAAVHQEGLPSHTS